jgi:hypothetical protein
MLRDFLHRELAFCVLKMTECTIRIYFLRHLPQQVMESTKSLILPIKYPVCLCSIDNMLRYADMRSQY